MEAADITITGWGSSLENTTVHIAMAAVCVLPVMEPESSLVMFVLGTANASNVFAIIIVYIATELGICSNLLL